MVVVSVMYSTNPMYALHCSVLSLHAVAKGCPCAGERLKLP